MKKVLVLLLSFFSLRADVLLLNINYQESSCIGRINMYMRIADAEKQIYQGKFIKGQDICKFCVKKNKNKYTLMFDNYESVSFHDMCGINLPMVMKNQYWITLNNYVLNWSIRELSDESILNGQDIVIHIQDPINPDCLILDFETKFRESKIVEYTSSQNSDEYDTELPLVLYIERVK